MGNTFHKHPIGYVIIALTGALLLAGLIAGIYVTYQAGSLTPSLFGLLSTLIVAVIFFTMISLWFYYWPVLIIGTSDVSVTNWRSFFSSSQVEAEWLEIEQVTVTRQGILEQLFDMGTLTVETAAALPNLTISRMPHAEALRDQIMHIVETTKAESKGE